MLVHFELKMLKEQREKRIKKLFSFLKIYSKNKEFLKTDFSCLKVKLFPLENKKLKL
jgi:hypothetical protein